MNSAALGSSACAPVRRPGVAVLAAGVSVLAVALTGCGGVGGTQAKTTTVTVQRDPNGAAAPAEGAAGASRQRSPEDYPRAAPGPNTSPAFAESVREQFVQQWVATGETAVTIQAHSPVTGGTYTMSCSGEDVVHCTGGHDAHVYIYSRTAEGHAAPQAPGPAATAAGAQYSGTVRDLDGYEFARLYPEKNANPPMPGMRVLFIELDGPATLTAGKYGMQGTFTDTTTAIRLEPAISAYAGRNGERVTFSVDPSQCTWPSDTTPPTGAPLCLGL